MQRYVEQNRNLRQGLIVTLVYALTSDHKCLVLTEILDDCFKNAVGIVNPSVIPNDQMTASSYSGGLYYDHYAFYGRLHAFPGWCALTSSNGNDWLQVDLGKELPVCGVATQGGATSFLHGVTDFKLIYSSDENNWTTYKYENGTEVVRFTFVLQSLFITI